MALEFLLQFGCMVWNCSKAFMNVICVLGERLREAIQNIWSCDAALFIVTAAFHLARSAVPVEALSFLRNYVGYTFGRQLMAVSRVQADVLVRYKGVSPGDYSLLAAQAESLFMPAGLYALDEYGVPAEIATKLQGLWGNVENVDQGLRMLARLDLGRMELDPFERDLLENVRSSLPVRAFVETAQ